MSFAEQLAARTAATKRSDGGNSDDSDDDNTSSNVSITSSVPKREGSVSSSTSKRVSFHSATEANVRRRPVEDTGAGGGDGDGDNDDGGLTPTPRSTGNDSPAPIGVGDQRQRRQQQRRGGRLKSENKKLRLEALLLKAKLEGINGDKSPPSDSSDAGDDADNDAEGALPPPSGAQSPPSSEGVQSLVEENGELRKSMQELRERCERLEGSRGGGGGRPPGPTAGGSDGGGGGGGDASASQLRQKLSRTESELAEVTELKNAEIEVLRKQLNRAERKRTEGGTEAEGKGRWDEEREGLREEIRRLNAEVSDLKEERQKGGGNGDAADEDEDEELGLTRRYESFDLDNSDVASLQSIIAMMRQTIDQSNNEKVLLERSLVAEQERSQMELRAFARTLEGVDDLRGSAEAMSREIRRIKVRGYRPTRSDLMASVSGRLDRGRGSFGELTAAVEASENMEEAIRLIESQNDPAEDRRRAGVVASDAAARAAPPADPPRAAPFENFSRANVSTKDRDGGFLSFWNNGAANCGSVMEEGDDDEDGAANGKSKEERKKKSKRRHRRRGDNGGGSVLTSFF